MDGPTQGRHRPPNWTKEEDEALCKAYVKISEGSATGTNQRRTKLWERILVEFLKQLGHGSDRESSGLMNRWSTIRGQINKYYACVQMIEADPQSGFNHENTLAAINHLFFEKNGCHFKFEHCWNILKKSSSRIWDNQEKGKEKGKHKEKNVCPLVVYSDSPGADSNVSTASSIPHSASPNAGADLRDPISTPFPSTPLSITLDDDGAPFSDPPVVNVSVRAPGKKAAKGKRRKKRSIYADYGSEVADKIKEGLASLSRATENKIEQELNVRAEERRLKMEEKRIRRETDIMLTNVSSMESEDQKIWLAAEQRRIAAKIRDPNQT